MRRSKAVAIALASICVIGGTQCARLMQRMTPEQTREDLRVAVPVIDSIRPDSVFVPYGAAVQVTLYGHGFLPGDPARNTVNFDRVSLRAIQGSPDGRRIVFVIPEQITSGGEAPPMNLQAGSYDVSVRTASGVSNPVTIRVYR